MPHPEPAVLQLDFVKVPVILGMFVLHVSQTINFILFNPVWERYF